VSHEDIRTAGAAALATLLGACSLAPVFSSGAWLLPVVAVVAVVLAGGLLLRTGGPALWARWARGRPVPDRLAAAWVVVVPLGQLLLLTCVLTARYAPGEAIAGVLPTPASLTEFARVLTDGLAEMQEQATPALPLTGLLALAALFVGLVAVTVDLVAVAGHQAGLAGLGLLALYCVPVLTITGSIGLVALAAPAAGLALLLWADQHRRLSARMGPRLRTGAGSAMRIGLAALVAGLVLGAVVPTLAEGSLATGLGGGTGSATGTSLDPVAQLRGELTRPEPIPLLRVDASVDDPAYLRSVTLDQYDTVGGWSMSNLAGETSIAEDDRLAPVPPDEPSRRVTADIEVLEHDDRFLPVLPSPVTVRMADSSAADWRFDPTTGTVFGRGVTTAGHRYRVAATEPRPWSALLAESPLPGPGDGPFQRFTLLPPLDPRITDLVARLTDGATGPYDRVRRIHEYLTDRSNGFIYSLSTQPGTSGDDLVDFLRLKRGYCEQYAGAMAVLVRAAGVPARVALGYTPGSVQQDGSRLVTSDDAHAWVEVHFDGAGWVPFDPTPIAVDRAVALPWAPRADAPADTGDQPAVPVPSAPAPANPTPQQDRAGGPVLPAQSSSGAGDGWRPVLVGAGVALLIAVVAGSPSGARALQRRRRVAEDTPASLWDELAATAVDLGLRVQPAWTLRQTAHELAGVMGGPAAVGPVAQDAVHRLALAEETARYGRTGGAGAGPDLREALRTARRGLALGASGRARWRARLWPASLLTGAVTRLAGPARQRLTAARARLTPGARRRGTRTV
jgi:hypothetical protein